MGDLSKDQRKRIAIVAGVAVALYLLYRYYQSRTASTAATSTTGVAAPDTAASDYASLAGQEQSDVAALQGQNSDLLGQEQSDVAGLQGAIGDQSAQEQSDISGLTGAIAGFSDAVQGVVTNQTTLSHDVTALALGIAKLDRNVTATVPTHQGGTFYAYYKRVTGHAPPARVQVNNAIYRSWKAGIKASALQKNPPHKSAPKQTHVQHPNPNHKPQTHVQHPNPPRPPHTAPKPPPPRRPPAPKPPPPKTKTKVSGRRK